MNNPNIEKITGEIRLEANNLPTEFPEIQSDEQLARASAFLSKIKSRLKEIKSSVGWFTAPLVKQRNEILSQKQAIEREFAKLSQPFEFAELATKEKMKTYHLKKEAEAKALEAKRIEENKTELVIAPSKTIKTIQGTTSFKKVWTFEITNESKIPKKYMTIDEKKIREAIKNGERTIAGVRIYEDTVLSNRPI